MESGFRRLSPAPFVLAFICFLLPFVTFSCQGQRIASFTGLQLAIGTTIEQPQPFGPPRSEKFGPEPLASAALLCVLVGLGFSLWRKKAGAISSLALGGLGFLLLAAVRTKLESDVAKQGSGVVQTSYGFGYYMALTFLLAAIAMEVLSLRAGKGIPLPALGSAANEFCPSCGSRNAAADLFCKECGAKFA